MPAHAESSDGNMKKQRAGAKMEQGGRGALLLSWLVTREPDIVQHLSTSTLVGMRSVSRQLNEVYVTERSGRLHLYSEMQAEMLERGVFHGVRRLKIGRGYRGDGYLNVVVQESLGRAGQSGYLNDLEVFILDDVCLEMASDFMGHLPSLRTVRLSGAGPGHSVVETLGACRRLERIIIKDHVQCGLGEPQWVDCWHLEDVCALMRLEVSRTCLRVLWLPSINICRWREADDLIAALTECNRLVVLGMKLDLVDMEYMDDDEDVEGNQEEDYIDSYIDTHVRLFMCLRDLRRLRVLHLRADNADQRSLLFQAWDRIPVDERPSCRVCTCEVYHHGHHDV